MEHAILTFLILCSFRKEYEIKVSGPSPPKPIVSFGHLGFDEQMMSLIARQGFVKPTQIQAQVRTDLLDSFQNKIRKVLS